MTLKLRSDEERFIAFWSSSSSDISAQNEGPGFVDLTKAKAFHYNDFAKSHCDWQGDQNWASLRRWVFSDV